MAMAPKTTFTLAEAAALLSCHPETLRRAVRDGELRAAKLGRGYRISRPDLEAFWTSSGGGELFPKSEEAEEELREERPRAERTKKKTDAAPRQLSLLSQDGGKS